MHGEVWYGVDQMENKNTHAQEDAHPGANYGQNLKQYQRSGLLSILWE